MKTEFKSNNWMRGVSDDKVIPQLFRFALLRLCLHRNSETGRCDPSHDTVAAEIGFKRHTILRAIDWGVRRGWLVTKHGQHRSNYEFTFPVNLDAPTVARSSNSAAPRRPKPQCTAHCSQIQQQCRTKTPTKTTPDPTVAGQTAPLLPGLATQMGEQREEGGRAPARMGARYPQDRADAAAPLGVQGGAAASINVATFAAFTQAYPKKTGMGAARSAFNEACNIADPDYIVARAALYAKDFEGDRARYAIPPKQWLEGECFNDPLPAGVTTVINNETGAVELVQPRPPHRNGQETLREKIARKMAECDRGDTDGFVH
jgi:hypothetical protein